MTARIDVHDVHFWYGLASSLQYNAGEELGLQVDTSELEARRTRGQVSAKYQPLLHLTFSYQERPKGLLDVFHAYLSSRQAPPPPVVRQERKETEQEKKDREATRNAAIGTGLLLAAGAVGGYIYSKWSLQRQSLHYTQTIRNALALSDLRETNIALSEDADELLRWQLEVDGTRTRKLTGYLVSVVALGVGGAMLAVGGFKTNAWLMTAGKIASVAGLFVWALNLGLHWSDGDKITAAQEQIVAVAERMLKARVQVASVSAYWVDVGPGGTTPSASIPGIPLGTDYRPLYAGAVMGQRLGYSSQ